MYPFSKRAYNQYKKCLKCDKCPAKGCPIHLKWENMDRGYYRATGNLLTGEEFSIHIPWLKEPVAEITLEKVDDLTHLNSWISALMGNTKYNIDITLKYADQKTLDSIIIIDDHRGTIHTSNKCIKSNTYKGWKINSKE